MRKTPFIHFRRLAACAAIASMVGCGANCNVPAFHGGATPKPGSTPTPVPLSCAQNAITGQGVPMGTAATFAVLAASTVTNTGPTIVTGDLGVSPGSSITGFGPGTVVGGSIHDNDPVAAQAQLDATTAFNLAAGRSGALGIPADIGGTVISPGVWKAPVSLAITGAVTLDGKGNPNSVFIFQIPSTLTVNVGSTVLLINGANPCNVFWEIGSSATLNTNSVFSGTMMAQASITLDTGAAVLGRALALTGAVTLDTNTVTDTGP